MLEKLCRNHTVIRQYAAVRISKMSFEILEEREGKYPSGGKRFRYLFRKVYVHDSPTSNKQRLNQVPAKAACILKSGNKRKPRKVF